MLHTTEMRISFMLPEVALMRVADLLANHFHLKEESAQKVIVY